MRPSAMMQFMRNQQATYETQIRTMNQPVPMAYTTPRKWTTR